MNLTRICKLTASILLIFSGFHNGLAGGTHYLIGVGSPMSGAERQAVWTATLNFAMLQMKLGDQLSVYNASSMQPVGELAIPDDPLFANPNPRLNRLSKPLDKLKSFFAQGGNHETQAESALLGPQFLDLAGRQLRASQDQPLTVILVGAPFYIDPKEPASKMTDGRYPSDGHILACQKDSIYGTAGKKDILKNVTVHYCYLRECFSNDVHRNSIGRFWTLFVEKQGGTLASFAGDPAVVFDRAARGITGSFMTATINMEDAKIQMHESIQRELAVAERPVPVEHQPASKAPDPKLGQGELPLQVQETDTEMKINLRGDVLFDFDKDVIRQDAEPTLDQVVKMIQKHPDASILVEGFTDSRGSTSYNLMLSNRRAASVKAWLVAKGIPERNIWSRGCGADKPIASNTRDDGSDDPDGRQKNRRVEITIKK